MYNREHRNSRNTTPIGGYIQQNSRIAHIFAHSIS